MVSEMYSAHSCPALETSERRPHSALEDAEHLHIPEHHTLSMQPP